MGRRRVRNLAHLGGAEIAGFEPSEERSRAVGEEHDIPIFTTYEDGIGWGPDALVISTPPDQHTPYALDALQRGVHWFTEASVVPGDLVELLELAQNAQTVCAP